MDFSSQQAISVEPLSFRRRKAEVERQLGAIQMGVEAIEHITADEYVLFGKGDDFQALKVCLGDHQRDVLGMQGDRSKIVAFDEQPAFRTQVQIFHQRGRDSRYICAGVQFGANVLSRVGMPRRVYQDFEERSRRLNVTVVGPHQRTTLKYGNL